MYVLLFLNFIQLLSSLRVRVTDGALKWPTSGKMTSVCQSEAARLFPYTGKHAEVPP